MPFYGTVLGKQKITLCFASYPSRVGNWGAPQFALPIARRSWQTVCQNIPWPLWTQMAKIAGFCIPCVAMVACYGAIGRVLIRAGGKCWRRQRTLRLMALLVVLFLLFQLPYTVVLLIKTSTPNPPCEERTKLHLLESITRNLACVRCCLNPLLYAFVGVRFRNDIIRLLTDAGCVCACVSHITPEHENGSSVTPSSPAPTILSPFPSTYLSGKKTPAADTAETFIFPTPISGKMTSVISWCRQ